MEDLVNSLLLFDKNLTEEELLIQKTVREYADNIIIPNIGENYEQAKTPENLIEQLALMGLFGMTLPEEYGGSNASSVAYGLACQELERADSAVRSFVSVQSSLCMYVSYFCLRIKRAKS